MRVARSLLLGLVVVLALAGVSAASASAHEFYASASGTTKDKGTTQKFTAGGSTVECKGETSEGTVTAGSSKTTVEKVKYNECTALLGISATVSEGEDEFSAEGWVTVLKAQTVKAASCEIVTPAQKERKAVTYENNKGKLKVKVALTELEYESTKSGLGCPKKGKFKGKEGASYSGEAETELPGGELEWK